MVGKRKAFLVVVERRPEREGGKKFREKVEHLAFAYKLFMRSCCLTSALILILFSCNANNWTEHYLHAYMILDVYDSVTWHQMNLIVLHDSE